MFDFYRQALLNIQLNSLTEHIMLAEKNISLKSPKTIWESKNDFFSILLKFSLWLPMCKYKYQRNNEIKLYQKVWNTYITTMHSF